MSENCYLSPLSKTADQIMKIIYQIISLFIPTEQPKYGMKIFQQQSWLTKQVDEEMRKRAFHLD